MVSPFGLQASTQCNYSYDNLSCAKVSIWNGIFSISEDATLVKIDYNRGEAGLKHCYCIKVKMASFELGEELRKMFFRPVTSGGQRKIRSPHEESNLRPSDLRSDALPLSHKDSSVCGVYYEVLMTRVLHTTRISNVDSLA